MKKGKRKPRRRAGQKRGRAKVRSPVGRKRKAARAISTARGLQVRTEERPTLAARARRYRYLHDHELCDEAKHTLASYVAGQSVSRRYFYPQPTPKDRGILGYGFGFKEVEGNPTEQEALRVYVVRKQRDAPCSRQIPKEIDGIPTDVIECGVIRPHSPIECGASIGSIKLLGSGTLGCVVEIGGQLCVLSCNHVLARVNQAMINEAAVHPAKGSGGTIADRIAGLKDFCDLTFNGSGMNEMDAAVALLDAPNTVSATQAGIGAITGPLILEDQIPANTLVQKSGARTKVTHGKITGFSEDFSLTYSTGQLARFRHQLSIIPQGSAHFSREGDSGSLVVTNDRPYRPVAMVFAGADNGPSFATPLERILKEFTASLT